MMTEERILGKFSCERCRRPSDGAGTLLVAKTWAPSLGNPRGNALCGEGEVIANAPLCRKKG
jgi:hypothetical protein